MLQGPDRSSSRSRRNKSKTRSNRANTTPQQLPDYLKDPNYKSPYAENTSGLATINDSQPSGQQTGHTLQKSTDDLLDLFSGFGNNHNNNNNGNNYGNNLNTSNNNNDDFMNPFASSVPNQLPSQQETRQHAQSAFVQSNQGFTDDFFGSSNANSDPFFGNDSKSNNNNDNNNNKKNENDGNSNDDEKFNRSPRPTDPVPSPDPTKSKEKSKEESEKPSKKKAKTRAARAQTAVAIGSPNKAAPDPPKKSKTKSIDVLPLLHVGVKANKFKFGQNKSKVRTFYLTKDNQWFCWEPVGGALQAKNNRKKIDPTRSIFIRSIREVKKNSAAMVQDLSFVPAQHKALTISIVYDLKGSEKKVNLMAYEPFHHVLVFEAIHKLSSMGQNINRDLGNVFELYVDFEKEILPKHLRPQRFKWEPLGANEVDKDKTPENSDGDGDDGNSGYDAMDVFDPTQDNRDRLKSF